MAYIGRTPTNSILTGADIADGSISTAKLADTAVSTAKIADDAVGNTKLNLASDYAFTGSVTGTQGDFEKITTTNQSSAVSSINYTNSIISTTYKTFKIVVSNGRLTDDNSNLGFRISTDNGSSFISSSSYARNIWCTTDDSGNDSFQGRASTTTGMGLGHKVSGGNASGESQNAELMLLNPHSTSNNKFVTIVGAQLDANGNGRSTIGHFRISTTSAISGIQLFNESGSTIASVDITIYGLRA